MSNIRYGNGGEWRCYFSGVFFCSVFSEAPANEPGIKKGGVRGLFARIICQIRLLVDTLE